MSDALALMTRPRHPITMTQAGVVPSEGSSLSEVTRSTHTSSTHTEDPMPSFSTTLPPKGKNHGFPLKRTPQTSTLSGIVTAHNLLVCDTHFWHGRTMPCERLTGPDGRTLDDSNCAACNNKQPFRSHTYISVFNNKTHEHFIFECTSVAAEPLADYLAETGKLRGCTITANRPKGGPNSRVVILCNTTDIRHVVLPNPPNVAAALAVIWRLPPQAIQTLVAGEPDDQHPERYATALAHLNLVGNELHDIRDQPDNAGEPPDANNRREHILQQFLAAAAHHPTTTPNPTPA
jgi:hypothetical protein